MLPRKKKSRQHQPSTKLVVEQAREKLRTISADYHRAPTVLKKVSLKVAKQELDQAYLQAESDYINGKIASIKKLHIANQHHAAWKQFQKSQGSLLNPQYA
jgi:hypothetical protein